MSNYDLNTFEKGHLIANRYQVIKLLGAGGMGSVYLCDDQFLEGTQVAVKVLHKEFCTDPNLEKRFLREIQLMNSVSNPHVVRTFDAGRDNAILYFTMEFVAGIPMDDYISQNGKLSINQFCTISLQICEGIDAIHRASIIHRDLKPSNIMLLNDANIKITDFGVAKPKSSKLTQHNEIIGSVDYMAPEIWLGNETTTAIDIYSLGIIFYQMITNQLPFSDDEPSKMMMYHVKRPPTPPAQHNPEIPAWLNHLILKMLSKAPHERPKSANEISRIIQANSKNLKPLTLSGKFPSVTTTMNSGKLRSLSQSGSQLNINPADFIQSQEETTSSRVRDLRKKKKRKNILLAIYALSCISLIIYFYIKIAFVFEELLLI